MFPKIPSVYLKIMQTTADATVSSVSKIAAKSQCLYMSNAYRGKKKHTFSMYYVIRPYLFIIRMYCLEIICM
jgi:hypothetical protein